MDLLSLAREKDKEPGVGSDIAGGLVSGVDTAASLAHGMLMFPPTVGAQAMGYAAGAVLPGVSGKELGEKYSEAAQSVTLQPGMIEGLFREFGMDVKPQAEKMAEPVSKAIEFAVPVEKLQHNLSRMKELGVPEGIADQAAFWTSKFIELLAFHGYHKVGSAGINKVKARIEKFNRVAESGEISTESINDVNLLVEDIKESTGAKTPEELQMKIYDSETARKVFLEDIQRRNAESKGAVQQQRDLLSRLRRNIPKERVKPKPLVEEASKETAEQKVIAAQRDIEAELKLDEPPPQRDKPVVKEAIKDLEGESPKPDEIFKAKEENVVREISEKTGKPLKKGTAYVTDEKGNYEYALYGKRKFSTVEEARKVIETEKRLQPFRKELQEIGLDLEIIKVGDSYRLAESLKLTATEDLAIYDKLSKSGKVKNLDIEAGTKELIRLSEDVNRFVKGEDVPGIKSTVDEIARLADDYVLFKDPAKRKAITEFAGNQIEKYNKTMNAKRQRLSTEDPEINMEYHPTKNPNASEKGLKVVLDKQGDVFKDPLIALDWMKKKGIEGAVESYPEGGYVIELRKPKPIKMDWSKYEPLKSVDDVSPVIRQFRDIMDDIVESFKLDKRGSISFKDLKPEKVEALRRLINDAARAGKSVREFMEKIGGYSRQQIEAMEGLVREASKEIDISVASTGVDKFNTGKIVNVGKLEKSIKGTKTFRQKIYEGERDAIMQAKEMSGKFLEEFKPTIHAITDTGSKYLKQLHKRYWQAEREIKRELKTVRGEILNLRKQLPTESAKKIGAHAIAQQEFGIERLKQAGITNIPILSPKELKAYEYMRERLEHTFNRVNNMRTSIGKSAMTEVPNYFTFMYSQSVLERAGLKPNSVLDARGKIMNQYAQFTATPFRFAKGRSKLGLKKALNLDIFDVYGGYMSSVARHVNLSPIVAKVSELRKPLKTGKFRDVGKGKKITKKEIFYTLKNDKPNLDNWLMRWSDTLAGHDVGNILAGIDKSVVGFALRKLNRNLAVSILGANLRSAMIQVSALRNTVVDIGPYNTAQGIIDTLSPRKFREAWKKSNILELRQSDAIFREMFEDFRSGKVGRSKEAIGRYSMAPLQILDYVTATASWRGAYRLAKKLGKPELEAIDFADTSVAKTQASGLPGDISPIQRTAMGKFLTMFQTFTINDWNFLVKDVLGLKDASRSNFQTFKKVATYVIATALFNSLFEDVLGIKSPFPTPIRAIQEGLDSGDNPEDIILDVFAELTEPIPVIGSTRYGKTILGPGVQSIGEFSLSFRDPLNRDKGDKVGPLWETGARLYPGVPGLNQVMKSFRASERGETPYGIAVGRYTKKKKRSKSGFGKF